jgi:hypothetical protein
MFYHPPTDGTTLQTMATQMGALVFTRGDEAYRDQMRSAGFSGPVTQYLLANEASGPPGLLRSSDQCPTPEIPYANNASGIALDFCTALHPDERNFLHNGRGERLYTTDSWQEQTGTKTVGIYMMNPAASGWRAYLALRAREQLNRPGYTGLFLDNIDLSMYRAQRQEITSDGAVAEYATNDAYRKATVSALAALRGQLGNAVLWANLTSGNDTASDWDPYLPYLDGVMEEYFVARWGNTYTSPTMWDIQLRRAETLLSQGKTFIAVGQGGNSDTTRMRFALASYLLVARDQAYFRYADADLYAQTWVYGDYQTRLGNSMGSRYQAGSLWRRDFACGYVTVDSVNHHGGISVDPSRPGCS